MDITNDYVNMTERQMISNRDQQQEIDHNLLLDKKSNNNDQTQQEDRSSFILIVNNLQKSPKTPIENQESRSKQQEDDEIVTFEGKQDTTTTQKKEQSQDTQNSKKTNQESHQKLIKQATKTKEEDKNIEQDLDQIDEIQVQTFKSKINELKEPDQFDININKIFFKEDNELKQSPSDDRKCLDRRKTKHLKSNRQKSVHDITKDPNWQKIKQEASARYKNAQNIGKIERLKHRMKLLIENTESRRLKSLTQRQYEILSDKAIYIKQQRPLNFLNFFLSLLDQCVSSVCLNKPFHPFSKGITFFQILESIVILFDIFFYTLFCFFQYFEPAFFYFLCLTSLMVFLVGTFLRMNTAFFEHGNVIFNKRRVFQKYRRELLMNDIIGYIGFCYQFFVNNDEELTKQLSFLLIFKYKVYKLNVEKLEQKQNLTGNTIHIWTLIKLLGSSLALCHIIGTAYFFLSFSENYYLGYQETWAKSQDLIDKNSFSQYLHSFFWALSIVTLIDTGYVTDIEAIFCLVTLIITIGLFATILSQVSMVWEEMAKKTKEYKKDNDTLCMFFKIHDITIDLQGQLHNFLKYSYQGHEQKSVNSNFEILMEKFPVGLQHLVKQERYNEKIKNFKIFNRHFSQKVLTRLIDYVREEYYMPNQIIFQKDHYKEPCLYLILAGQVEKYMGCHERGQIIGTYNENDFFGQQIFFSDTTPHYSAKSSLNTYTTLLTISRNNFRLILKTYGTDRDRELFTKIQHDILIHDNSEQLESKCNICQSITHKESGCNILQYQPNIENLMRKQNYSFIQERKKSHKRQRDKDCTYSALPNMDELLFYQEEILSNADMRKYLKVIQETLKDQEKKYLEEEQQLETQISSDDEGPMNFSKRTSQQEIEFITGRNTFLSPGNPAQLQRCSSRDMVSSPVKKPRGIKKQLTSKNSLLSITSPQKPGQQRKISFRKLTTTNLNLIKRDSLLNQMNNSQSIVEENIQDDSEIFDNIYSKNKLYQQINKIPSPKHSISLSKPQNTQKKKTGIYAISLTQSNVGGKNFKNQMKSRKSRDTIGHDTEHSKSYQEESEESENELQLFLNNMYFQNLEFQKNLFDFLNKAKDPNNGLQEQEMNSEQNAFIIIQSDRMQKYDTFYPHNNYIKSIESYNEHQAQLIKNKYKKGKQFFMKAVKAAQFLNHTKANSLFNLKKLISPTSGTSGEKKKLFQ